MVGRRSMSYLWGMDRGQAIDRFYLEERFLTEFAGDIKGHCLEFGKPWYTNRFGAGVTKADVLTAPHDADFYNGAEIVADLTKPNDIPSDTYDCIVCTQVINVVPEYSAMIRELHRILRPGGVLLIAVPHVNMNYPKNPGLFRFTPDGLMVILTPTFGDNVTIRSYGNSLTGAALLRGLVASELPKRALDYYDEYYP